ncbi:hypothetical protein G7046_g6593 [Stylonectria norvegica]|nr:hypothetical protein G7046_g6593 [Stylonectria norvegica]
MAKSARSSSRKANNQRLAAKVFGPVEDARRARLSARLVELANQPKPEPAVVKMDVEEEVAEKDTTTNAEDGTKMEVDSVKPSSGRIEKKKIDKRRVKKSGITFRKYTDRAPVKRKKAAAAS